MYVPIPSVPNRVVSRALLLVALLVSAISGPLALAQERVPAAAPNTPAETVVNEDESLPLTDAQQAAKQLVSTLEQERTAAAPPASRSAVMPLSEPGLTYKRFMVKIYTTDHVDVVMMGGRPTLISPVDSVTADETDARRPTLIHTEDGAIAIGVFMD